MTDYPSTKRAESEIRRNQNVALLAGLSSLVVLGSGIPLVILAWKAMLGL